MCGETKIVMTNLAQLYEWEGFGLKLHIREGTLPPDTDQCIVRIKASTSGQYQFPKGFQLVSAVFWLRCEPICRFTKSITMEMEHCAKLENANKLTFVRAVCNQETLPYAFKKIGGTFSEVEYWGAVELNGFSGEAIALDDTNQCEYGAMVFHTIHPSATSYIYMQNRLCGYMEY